MPTHDLKRASRSSPARVRSWLTAAFNPVERSRQLNKQDVVDLTVDLSEPMAMAFDIFVDKDIAGFNDTLVPVGGFSAQRTAYDGGKDVIGRGVPLIDIARGRSHY